MNKTEMMTSKQAMKLGEKTAKVMKNIKLQNDLYNFLPSPKQADKEKILIAYSHLYDALDNIFEVNQELAEELDEVAFELYELSDQLENKK